MWRSPLFINENPYADIYNNRVAVYYKLGQYQQAIEDFNKAISLQTNFVIDYNL